MLLASDDTEEVVGVVGHGIMPKAEDHGCAPLVPARFWFVDLRFKVRALARRTVERLGHGSRLGFHVVRRAPEIERCPATRDDAAVYQDWR